MPRLVMKFGGTSVADTARIKAVARRLVAAREAGNRVVAVLSAMGDTTDDLVDLANGVSLDFMDHPEPIDTQHYAFLVSDEEFEAGLERVKSKGLTFWADPSRQQPGAVNHHFGGRGFYFENPDGHLLELITTPYGEEE